MDYRETFDKFHYYAFEFLSIGFFILYAVIFVGLIKSEPEYLLKLNGYLKIYICLYLIYRFNPLRKNIKFTKMDSSIAFHAGVYILATTAFSNAILYYLKNIKSNITSQFQHAIAF